MSAVLPVSAMRRVTCAELRTLAAAYRPALHYAAARCACETKVYLHWTAGHYGQFFADYHVQVDADGGIYVIGDGVLDDVLAATYRRNSGSVSIALLGCVGATTDDLGCEPPTAAQIEALAQAVTALAAGLWLTIDKERILTHGEARTTRTAYLPTRPTVRAPPASVGIWSTSVQRSAPSSTHGRRTERAAAM